MTTETRDTAKDQARAQLDGIVELMAALETDGGIVDGDTLTADQIQDRIQQDPLSVQVRENWHNPGDDADPEAYMILLCTGGPAVRIIGDLDNNGQPDDARLEYQDWGTPWTEYYDTTTEEDEALLKYACQFYYGD